MTKKSYTCFGKIKRMKTVVICGSRRFKKEIREFGSKLIKAGIVVFSPYLHEGKDEWDKLSLQYKKFVALGLTHNHFYKIRMADVVFVYNKDGYAGVSTALSLGMLLLLGSQFTPYRIKMKNFAD